MTEIADDPRAAVTTTPDGRVTIPAQIRRAADIEAGQTLIVYVDNGRIVFEEKKHMLTRLQDEAIAAARAAGHTENPVDALIEQRRSDARNEGQR